LTLVTALLARRISSSSETITTNETT
jgi:hypothetical protein